MVLGVGGGPTDRLLCIYSIRDRYGGGELQVGVIMMLAEDEDMHKVCFRVLKDDYSLRCPVLCFQPNVAADKVRQTLVYKRTHIRADM